VARLTTRDSVLSALAGPGDKNAQSGSGASTPRAEELLQSARDQAEFYVAYAEMLEERRQSPESAGDWDPAGRSAGEWAGQATLANSYRQAAQYACLVDTNWATRLTVQAGVAYVNAGLPYGLFLLAGVLDDQALLGDPAQTALVRPFEVADAAPAVQHPVQLTYLQLAAAARPELRGRLSRTLEEAPQRLAAHELRPIGPQSVPLGDYLDLAVMMLNDDQSVGALDNRVPRQQLAARLADMHRTQAASLRAARRNQYLWRNGASRVNVVDLEHVALSGLALRRGQWFDDLSEEIAARLDRDDPLAELPLWAMATIKDTLPAVASDVDRILRQPERAWHEDDFADYRTPFDGRAETSSYSRDTTPEEDTRPRNVQLRRPEASEQRSSTHIVRPQELENPKRAIGTSEPDPLVPQGPREESGAPVTGPQESAPPAGQPPLAPLRQPPVVIEGPREQSGAPVIGPRESAPPAGQPPLAPPGQPPALPAAGSSEIGATKADSDAAVTSSSTPDGPAQLPPTSTANLPEPESSGTAPAPLVTRTGEPEDPQAGAEASDTGPRRPEGPSPAPSAAGADNGGGEGGDSPDSLQEEE
jgi:hypothetical protein